MYCLKHAQKYAGKANTLGLAVDRLVTVYREEEEGRKRGKTIIDHRELKVALGSLQIDRLGTLVDASDTRQVLCCLPPSPPPTWGRSNNCVFLL